LNEDRYGVSAFQTSENDTTPVTFAIVADGIGGKQAGEIAAEIAVNTITDHVAKSDGGHPLRRLHQSILDANLAIIEEGDKETSQEGMGTTVACVWVTGQNIYTATVGNSRIYLFRNKELRQLSIDHTWVQEARNHGVLNKEQAEKHPMGNIITRYLGSENDATPDYRLQFDPGETDEASQQNQGMLLYPDDIILICSDGLSDYVQDQAIANALYNKPLQEALEHLTDLALKAEGKDNITSIALQVPSAPEVAPPPPIEVKAKRGLEWWFSLLVLGLITVLFLLVLGWFVWQWWILG
jgi:protein phosphatase